MAGFDDGVPLGVPCEAIRVTRPLADDPELAGAGVDPPHRAGEGILLAARLDPARVEHAVEPVEPAVRSPGQRARQLVGVGAPEPRDDDFGLIRLAVAVGVPVEQEVGGVEDQALPARRRCP